MDPLSRREEEGKMTLCTTMLWALFIRNVAAESACDSGCSASGPWWPGPQVETEGLPSNTRLLVLDESATVTGPDGAALEMVSEPAPPDTKFGPSKAVIWSSPPLPVRVSPKSVPVMMTRSIEFRVSVPPRPSDMTVLAPSTPVTAAALKVTPATAPI